MASIQYFAESAKMLWATLRHVADADLTDVRRWLDLCGEAIKALHALMRVPRLSVQEKQKCLNIMTQLLSIQRLLDQCSKRGGDLQQQQLREDDRVSWNEVQTAFESRIVSGVITNLKHLNVSSFMEDAKLLFETKIKLFLEDQNAVKVNAVLAAEYIIVKENEETIEIKHFNTQNGAIYRTTNLQEWFVENIQQPIERDMEEFQERDSGWTLRSILNLTVNINTLNPMQGSSYIPLPDAIRNRKACVNVKNEDNQCFKWAILSKLHSTTIHSDRVSNYRAFERELNFAGIEFPVMPKHIAKFERQNDISVNLYILQMINKRFKVVPCHLTLMKKENHVNLLLVQDYYVDEVDDDKEARENDNCRSPKFHYVWIKSLSRLVTPQMANRKRKSFICDRCLHYFWTDEQLQAHEIDCARINKCKIQMPTECNKNLQFKNFNHKGRVPYVLYADFECLLKPITGDKRAYQNHVPLSVNFYVQCSYDDSRSGFQSYR